MYGKAQPKFTMFSSLWKFDSVMRPVSGATLLSNTPNYGLLHSSLAVFAPREHGDSPYT